MQNDFIRAKSEENKQIRINQILSITDKLFENNTYHNISLTTISDNMRMSRGNLYKYFNSKEEIFLEIYSRKQKIFINSIVNKLNKMEIEDITTKSFAQDFSEVLENNFDYLKYHRILTSIIETNVSIENLAEFKLENHKTLSPLLEIIKIKAEVDSIKEAFHLYLTIISHACYLYDRVNYQDAYVKAMKLANLEIADIDFKSRLNKFITICCISAKLQ